MRSNSRLWLLVIALLATAMIAVGCGDDDDGGDSGGGTTAAQTDTGGGEATTEEAPPAETTEEAAPEDTGGGDASDPNVQAAIDACKQQVAANPSVSDAVKEDINTICDEIASGDADQIREKTKEVCTKIVEETVPEGTPGREQALEACDAATAAP